MQQNFLPEIGADGDSRDKRAALMAALSSGRPFFVRGPAPLKSQLALLRHKFVGAARLHILHRVYDAVVLAYVPGLRPE